MTMTTTTTITGTTTTATTTMKKISQLPQRPQQNNEEKETHLFSPELVASARMRHLPFALAVLIGNYKIYRGERKRKRERQM